MTLLVYEVLEKASKQRKKEDKINILKQNESWALKDILKGSMDDRIQWALPAGSPPYSPNDGHNAPANLLRENQKFKYFVKGGPGDKMLKARRENLFIGLIEGIHPEDAKLVINMINKQKPYGLTKPIINQAFPGLIGDT